MPSNRNCIKTAFLILTLYAWQCSTQKIPTQNNLEENSQQFPTAVLAKYRYYVGCFSKRLWDEVAILSNATQILYGRPLILEECFNSCQVPFLEHSTSELNLVAIQYHLCVCIPIYVQKARIRLYQLQVPYSCNLREASKTSTAGRGGTYSVSIYTTTVEAYSSFKKGTQQIFEIIQENSMLNPDIIGWEFINVNREISSGEIRSCTSSKCTLRIDINGTICKNFVQLGIIDIDVQARRTFLNMHVPESSRKPRLCLDYCNSNSLHKNLDLSKSNNEKHNLTLPSPSPTLAIQSTIKELQPFDSIELCHCTDHLPMLYPLSIEKCSKCPLSGKETQENCIYFDFHHRIYGSITENRRTSTTGSSNEITSTTDMPDDIISNSIRGTIRECLPSNKCKGQDNYYGNEWEGCPGEKVKSKCGNSPTSGGNAYWDCSANGSFLGEQPDYSNCTSQDLLDIETNYQQNESDPNSEMNVLKKLRDLVTTDPQRDESEGAKFYGHEIQRINNIVKKAIEKPKENFKERENITTEAVTVLGNMMATNTPWRQLDAQNRSSKATDVLLSVENTFFVFANSSMKEIFNKTNDELYTKVVTPINNDPKGFEVTLEIRKNFTGENIKFPAESNSSYIKIPHTAGMENEDIVFVGMIVESNYMKNLTAPNIIKPKAESRWEKTFNGKIISLTFSNSSISQMATGQGVIVRIVHDVKSMGKTGINFRRKLHPGEQNNCVVGETECAYWDTKLLLWSTEGCKKLEDLSTSQETICECNHLTAFAVLADVHGYIGKEKGLEVLTLILCSLSIFCLIATIVILTRIKVLHGERTTITKHLCFNLILGNVLMLLLVDKDYFNLLDEVCITVGIVTHYVFLCAFGWMAVQGLYLYRMVIVIFNTGKNYMPYYTVGAYCYPILPISFTLAIGYGVGDQRPYGGCMFCWLNGNYIWAFMGPAGVILIGNFAMTILALRKVREKLKSKLGTRKQINSNRKWIQGCFTLSVLLGLTWVTAFFTLLDEPSFHFMSYVFTVANASQGLFILIFNCLLNEKVKPLILDKMGKFGLVFSKDDKSSSEKFNKQTRAIDVPFQDSKSKLQNVVPGPMKEDEDPNENRQESSRLTTENELDACQQEQQSSKRKLTVLESQPEGEDESDLLCEINCHLHAKLTLKTQTGEESYSEHSYSEQEGEEPDESDQFEDQDSSTRRRRYIGPPYIDELVESDLYLQMGRSDAERSVNE